MTTSTQIRIRIAAALLLAGTSVSFAQSTGGGAPTGGRGGGTGSGGRGFQGQMDSVRARQLYVSTNPKDLPGANFAQQITQKNRTNSI